jgi:hypothetical protein
MPVPIRVICVRRTHPRRSRDVRICRNEGVKPTHIHARTGILTHAPSTLSAIDATFSIVLIGNQIADYERL